MAVEIWMGEEKWRIVDVYVKGDMEKKLKVMKEWLKEQGEDRWTIIGEDFNVRTGTMREREQEEETERRTKDGKINGEGRKLVGKLEKVGGGNSEWVYRR